MLDRKGRKVRSLSNLLKAAKNAGLLCDDGFPSLKRRREAAAKVLGAYGRHPAVNPEPLSKDSYVDNVIEFLPKTRNEFAHPKIHTIVPLGMPVESLILAAESINQLWEKPNT